MIPRYSKTSKQRLATCHPALQDIFNDVIRYFDCTIICGHRGKEAQNAAYAKKKSKVVYPDSKHNYEVAMAVDACPYPVDWGDTDRMYFFGGFVIAHARIKGIPIRWGGDWDSDTFVHDQKFIDLAHFELIVNLNKTGKIEVV